jgi:hypothetical protein
MPYSAAPKFLVLIAALAAATVPFAAQTAEAAKAQIYQQRTSDGRIVLTDSPLASARTEKVWAVEHEDPAAARLRSEQVRLEAQAVSDRIQRRMELQHFRNRDSELESLRTSLAEARREVDRSRQTSILVVPQGRHQVAPEPLRGTHNRDLPDEFRTPPGRKRPLPATTR